MKKQIIKTLFFVCMILCLCIFPIACGSGGSGDPTGTSTGTGTGTSSGTGTSTGQQTSSFSGSIEIISPKDGIEISTTEGTSVEIKAIVTDSDSIVQPDVKLKFYTDYGRFTRITKTDENGEAYATLKPLTSQNEPRRIANVYAYVGDENSKEAVSKTIKIHFLSQLRYVSGYAYGTDGKAIEGASVSAFSEYTQTVETNEEGFYSMYLPVGDHTVVISHEDYAETYKSLKIMEDDTAFSSDGLLINSSITTKGHPFSITGTFSSNMIDGQVSVLTIPPQQNNIATANGDTLSSAQIGIDYFEPQQILPVPLPNAENYTTTFVDGQSPSIVVSIRPGLLKLSNKATLTLPNPNQLTDTNNYVLHYLPDKHKWIHIAKLNGTPGNQTVSISEGGIYGIFFNNQKENQFRLVQGRTESPNSFVFIGDKSVKSDSEGYFSAKVYQLDIMKAYVYNPAKSSIIEIKLNTNGGSNEPVDAFVYDMILNATPTSIYADGTQESIITALLISHDHNPIKNAEVQFSSDDGRIDGAAFTDDKGKATVTLTSSNKINPNVTVTALYSKFEKTVTVKFVDPPSPEPEKISIDLSHSVIHTIPESSYSDSAYITAFIVDVNGNPIEDGQEVTISSSFGDIDQDSDGIQQSVTAHTTDGKVYAQFKSAKNSVGIAIITVSVDNISQQTLITIEPGSVNKIKFSENQISLVADGQSMITLTALVYDANDNPAMDDETIVFDIINTTIDTDYGRLIPSARPTKGGRAVVTYQAGTQAGTIEITATSVASSENYTVFSENTFVVTLINAPIATINLESDAVNLKPNEQCTITATLFNAKNFRINYPQKIHFSTTNGDIDNTQPGVQHDIFITTTNGVASAMLKSPSKIQGTAKVTATVDDKSDSVDIRFVPGPVANIQLSATAETIKGDGKSQSIISATVKDKNDNIVLDGEPIHFYSSDHSVDITSSTLNGVASFTYHSSIGAKNIAIIARSENNITSTFNILQTATLPKYMSLSVSQVTVKSDNSDAAEIIAILKDESNTVIPGMSVLFSANGGQLLQGQDFTDEQGQASTSFKSGTDNKTNREVIITAEVEGVTLKREIPINIEGSSVSLFCDNTVITKDGNVTAELIATAQDAGNIPVFDVPLSFSMKKSSENQGQLSLQINGKSYSETRLLNQTFNTNTLGQVKIIVSGVKGENEGLVDIELSVGALGYTAVQDFQLKDSGYTVQFVEPIDDQITYMVGEAPVQLTVSSSQDSTLIFSTSLGYFTNGEKTQAVKCDPSGLATTTFQALAAGLASIQVYDQQNTSISDDLKIAIAQPKEKAAQLTLQANPKVIGISTQAKKETAEIIATVLTSDDSGNDNYGSQVVGNATVVFSIAGSTGGGEFIDPVSVQTDSSGRAKTIFTSGTLSSDARGVQITASVQDGNVADKSIFIKIGGSTSSMSIGTATESRVVNPTTYATPMSIIVSDSNGNRMANTEISLSLWPIKYRTGYWQDEPECKPIITGAFPNEDSNRNLILDNQAEDVNKDGQLTPPSSAAGNVPSVVKTDENGVANFDLVYLKSNAVWIENRLEASTIVHGSATTEVLDFVLPYVVSDACFLDASPYENKESVQKLESLSLKSTSENVIADGQSSVVVTASLMDHNNEKIFDNQEITFSTTGGCLARALSSSIAEEDCLQTLVVQNTSGTVQVRLFASRKVGNANVTAIAENGVNSVVGPISFIPGPPKRIIIVPEKNSLNADGQSKTNIRINVLDKTDNPVADGESVRLEIDHGNLNKFVAQTSNSLVNFEFTSPGSIPSETYANITVTTTNNVVQTARILLKPYVRSINVTNGRTTIASNDSTLITATVKDSKDEPMSNIPIIFQSTGGKISEDSDIIQTIIYKVTDSNGQASVPFLPINRLTGEGKLVIKAGDVTAETIITVVPGPVKKIVQVDTNPSILDADNQSTSEITALILDDRDNPVADGQWIQFSVIGTNAKTNPANGRVSTQGGNVSLIYTASSDYGQFTVQICSESKQDICATTFITQKQASVSQVNVYSSDAVLMAGESCHITAHLKDAGGQFIASNAMVIFKSSIGDIDPNKPGVQNAIMTTAFSGKASTILKAPTNILGETTITVLVDNFSGTAQTSMTIIPGPIASIHLTATPDMLDMDDQKESIITATATDIHGNPVADGESIRFMKTGAGHLSAPSGSTIGGMASVKLIADATASMVTLVAKSETGDVSDSVLINISQILPAKMSISTSKTSVKSDNTDQAEIDLIVLDENNFVLPGIKVFFDASGGQLKILSDITDENGKATAYFSSGTVDRNNHTVVITARISNLSPVQIPVRISGSSVTLETDNTNITVPSGNDPISSTLTISVKDAGGNPVFNAPISFQWEMAYLKVTDADDGEELQLNDTRTSDVNGQYVCKVEGINEKDEVSLKISSLNATAEQIYKVSAPGNAFSIVSPDTSPYQLSVDAPLTIQVKARPAGVTTVVFSASIGAFENNENVFEKAVPQGNDIVETTYKAPMAGLTTIQVYDKYRERISDSLKVAVTQPTNKAGKLLLQSNALVLPLSSGGTMNSVTLKAKVLTTNNQVVGNAPVVFTILNPTGGGESISPVIAFTDATGVAETLLTSGSLSSGSDGVNIRAAIVGNSSISDSVEIVIGGAVGSISIGIGTEVKDINSTTYSLPMSILVSDANGNSVPGAIVTLGTWPTQFSTGRWGENVVFDNEGKLQTLDPPCRAYVTGTFRNEDVNKNLLLDEGEDLNHDGQLTPPNSSSGNLPSTVITDASGVANFELVYLKMNGAWVETKISASTIVHGTETLSSVKFNLPVAVKDVCHLSASPYAPPDDGTLAGQVEKIILTATPNTLIRDGRSKSKIEAIVTDEEGYPVVDGEMIRFEITQGKGTISSTSTSTSSGRATIIYTAASNTQDTTQVVITATSSSSPVTQTVEIQLIPAFIEMNAMPPSIPADGETQASVSAVLKDGKNNPVINAEVKFSTNLGTVQASAMTNEFGKATAILVSSKQYGIATVTSEYSGYTQQYTVVFEKLPGDPIPSKVSLSTSQISVKSDNKEQATITAIVLDKHNAVLKDVNVIFRATDGQLSESSVATDENGEASTQFSSGAHDKTNRTVTITAETGGLTPVQIPIVITGSKVELDADNSSITMPSQSTDYTQISAQLVINVSDAGGQGVFNTPIDLTWSGTGDIEVEDPAGIGIPTVNGFKLWSDVTGKATVLVKGKNSGSVDVTAHALGATAKKTFIVSAPGYAFGILSPQMEPFSLVVGEPLPITVRGGPPGHYTVVYSTTSGKFDNNDSVCERATNANGLAKAVFVSHKAGMATIQVYNQGNYQTSDSIKLAVYQPVEKASKILLQSSSSSVPISTGGTQNTITLRATVTTDFTTNNQVVGNAPVIFSIVNPTGGGEFISPVIVYTDNSGVATTRFTSGSLGSTANGVTVDASLLSMPDINEQVKIVIGGVAGSVAIGRGTSRDIVTVGKSAYALPMSVLVADANGNRIAGAVVSLNAWPGKYHTGYWKANIVYDYSGKPYTLSPPCVPVRTGDFPNEDINENLFMDPGEDSNNDTELTPPNSAAGNLPSTVITDENGVANFDLIYLKASAQWISNRIQASTYVHGTETVSSISFILPNHSTDVCNLPNSPFVNYTGSVDSIQVTASQSYLIAGHSCIISALIKDDEGKVIADSTPVYFVASGGDINGELPGSQPTFTSETVHGIATATLVSPLDDLTPIEVTVRASDFTDSIYIDVVSVPPAHMSLSTSKIAVNSDNSDHAIITAIVLDENNSVLNGVNVAFHTSSGQLSTGYAPTDENGKVEVLFSAGNYDQSNRTATITAKAEGLTPVQIPVLVSGSTIEMIPEKTNITVDSGVSGITPITDQLRIKVLDSGEKPVYDTEIQITVDNDGNPRVDLQLANGKSYTSIFVNAAAKTAIIKTDVLGEVRLKVVGRSSGDTVVKAKALGATASTRYKVSQDGDEFGIVYPKTDIHSAFVNEPLMLTVQAGAGNVSTVVFSTTSGFFDISENNVIDSPVIDGFARATLESDVAGLATIQVYDKNNYQTSDSLKIAFSQPKDKADKILLQSSASSLPVSLGNIENTINLKATVLTDYTSGRQVVENVPVLFSIEKPTGGGEFITPVIVITNSAGIASTRFTSGSLGSSADGVLIKATLINKPDIEESLKIVIGGVAGSVAIGRGSSLDIVALNPSTYALPMSVLVSDANGNRMANAQVSLSAWPVKYSTGYWGYDPYQSTYSWCTPNILGTYENEDLNENIYLDPGEDLNGDGELTPPNAAAGNLPSSVTTDENGVANFNLVYLKSSAVWITNRIRASTFVHGTETRSSVTFNLPYMTIESCEMPNAPYINLTGSVKTISLAPERDYLVAGSACAVVVTVLDDDNKPIRGNTPVVFTSSAGDIDPDIPGVQSKKTMVTQNGQTQIDLVSPKNMVGSISVSAESSGITTSTTIEIIPGDMATIDLIATPNNLTADGESKSQIEALVTDQFGNPVIDGEMIIFEKVGLGILSDNSATTKDGRVELTYQAASISGETTIRAISGAYSTIFDEIVIPLIRAQVGTVTIESDSYILNANGSTPASPDAYSAILSITVKKENKELVEDGTLVTIETDMGDLDHINNAVAGVQNKIMAATQNGIARVFITSPSNMTGVAEIVATAGGKSSKAKISIVPGPVSNISMSAEPAYMMADNTSQSQIQAMVSDINGNPVVNGETILFEITGGNGLLGSTGKVAGAATSDGIAEIIYTAASTPGTITISATSASNMTVTGTVNLTLTKIGEAALSVESSKAYLVANGSSCQLKAILTDPSGQYVPDGTYVKFVTTMGDLDSLGTPLSGVQNEVRASTVNGQATVQLTSPTNMIGTATITVSAGELSQELNISIVPGPANWIHLNASPNNLNADGTSTSTIKAIVTDIHGNAVINGETIHFALLDANGRLSAETGSTIDGETSVVYTAGYTQGKGTIEAWSDAYTQVRQTIEIVLIDSEIQVDSIMLESTKDAIIANGSGCEIIATVRDDSGNIVEDGARVTFTTTLGDLDPYSQTVDGVQKSIIAETVNGQARIKLVSPTNLLGEAEITATIGGKSESIIINIIPGMPKNIVLTATPNNLFADGMSTSSIQAFVSDAFGNTIVDGETITFTLTGNGRFAKTGYTQATASTQGGKATVSYIAGTVTGIESIVATANANNITQSIPITLINGDVEIDSIILHATKTILTAGGYTCSLQATVKDQDGNFINDGTMVTFTTTIGDIDNLNSGSQQIISIPTNNGQASVVLTTPTNILGNAKITATVGGKNAEETITIVPGPVGQINLSVISTGNELTSSTSSETTIKAKVMDRNGNNVVDGETIVFTIEIYGGETTNYTRSTVNGVVEMLYNLSSSAETVTITATSISTLVKVSKTINLSDPNVMSPHDMSISTNKQSVASSNTDTAIITAIVLDKSYAALSGITVNFSANGGLLSHGSTTTGPDGRATVTFSSGDLDKQNRIVTITATVEGLVRTIPIQIIGSTVELSCDKTSLTDDGSLVASCTATAKDAGKQTIYNTPISFSTGRTSMDTLSTALVVSILNESGETPYTITSGDSGEYSASGGNPGPYTAMTNIEGKVNFKIRGILDKTGVSKLIVRALGNDSQQEFIINRPANAFGIIETDPSVNDSGVVELSVGNWMGIKVNAGTATAKPVTIVFSTSVGQFGNGQSIARIPVAQAGGSAYTELRSTVSGLASIQVYREDNQQISDTLNVAISHSPDKAGQLLLQSEASVIPMSKNGVVHTVELKATVLTSASEGSQVVGNAPVVFSIVNPVGGQEFLSPVVVYTDSSGVARSIFTSGSIGSDSKGLTITATLVDNSSISSHVNMIIGGTPGSISIGLADKATSLNETTYSLPVSVLVSDANGSNISGIAISLNIWPEKYSTGYFLFKDGSCNAIVTGTFPNEDTNQNLILDAGEDLDNNGKLTPASSSAGNIPSVVYTDNNGVASFNLVYLKTSMWITARLSASTIVQGTEATAVMSFRMPYIADDACRLPDSPYLASSNDIASINLSPSTGKQINAGGISCDNASLDCSERWTFIEAMLLDNSGNLVKDGMPVVFKTTAGSLADSNGVTSNSTPADAGVRMYTAFTTSGIARIKLFSSDKLGKAVVSAESGLVKVSTVVEFIAGPASQIIINPSPVSLPADGESESQLLITVLDATGNPVNNGETVNVSVDHGVLNRRVDTTTDGFVYFIYTAPSSLPNNEVASIHAVVSNGVETIETINLTGPPISAIELSIEPDSLPMDGQSKATVFATVSLSGGGTVPDGTTVNFSIVGASPEKGSIEENGLTASGVARAILTAGTTSDPVTIRAEAGGRTSEIVIRYTQGSMNVSIIPNSILGTGMAYASVVAVPKDVTGNVEENAVVLFQIDNTAMGGFTEFTTLTNEMLSSGGSSQFTARVINGEAKAYFIGANIGDKVKITAIWDQNSNNVFDTNEVSGYESLDIQPAPSFIIIGENSPDPSSINIKGTGGVSTSQIVFEVKDSSGQLVSDGYKILFSINSGPNGGEDIQPMFAYTKDGKVSTILRSGFKSGPVSIKAVYYNDTSISTNTSQVAINAGPPVGEEFGISARYSNISGLYNSFLENNISVNAGDIYGNMIPDKTVISFKTYNTGGLFQPNIAVTQSGIASNVLLSTGTNPEPLQGFVFLTAEANNGGRTTHITCLAVTPDNNQIIYAGTNGGGVYKSIDSGGEWVNISRSSEYAGQNVIDPYINDIAIDPADPNTVYAATGYLGRGNVYRSLDGGLNWNSNNTEEWYGLLGGLNSAVQTVLCDDFDEGYTRFMWIGTDGQGILYSKDGGDTFLELGNTKPAGNTILLSDPDAYSNPNNVGNGYMRLPNLSCSTKGQTWTAKYIVSYKSMDNKSNATYSENIDIQDGISPESWTVRKVDISSWVLTNETETQHYTAALNENRVATFDQTSPLAFTVYENEQITSAIGENCVFHLAGQWEVRGSTTGKQGGTATNNLYYHTDDEEVEFIIISGSTPFGHNDEFSFISESGGLGCGKSVRDIVKVPGSHGMTAELFAATSTGVYRSIDGGRVWSETKNFVGDNITTLELIKRNNDIILFAGTQNAGVWYTYENGVSWIKHNDGLGYGLSTTTPTADVENIGNGTVIVTLPDDTGNTRTETWIVTCESESKDGGVFSVIGTSSGVRLSATVGAVTEYTEMVLYIIDGEKDFQKGDQFTFRTIRDPGMEIKDLLVYSTPDYSERRLYAITNFWGVLEPHAVGSIYSVSLSIAYTPDSTWTRTNEISGLPPYEPPGDVTLFAQHVMATNIADNYKALNNREKPSQLYIGGEGINFCITDSFSNLATGELNWQESKIGLSNLIMARRPVLFSDTCHMTVKEQILWGNPDTLAYFLYEIYVQDKNGNPPIQGSLLTYSTYKISEGAYKVLDGDVTICDYPDTMISQGTYRDKSDPETNVPFRLYLQMGQDSKVRGVEFRFRPASYDSGGNIVAPGSSGSEQKTPRYEY